MAPVNMIGFVYNSLLAEARDYVDSLADSLGLKGRCWTSSAVTIHEHFDKMSNTSMVIVAGGDGTILRTVRVIASYGIPIVSINMGRVGFMTELSVDEAERKLPEYMNGDFRVENRMMLEASVRSGANGEHRQKTHALNDVVVGRGSIARLLDIDTTVDGVPLTSYRADALIVSTATGSTGYALSAGGPILYPENEVILIQPVAAHTGLRSGLVLPASSVIDIKASDEHEAVLSVDGFPDMALHHDDTVTVKRSPHTAKFLRAHPPNTFYRALTRRLGLEPYPNRN